MSNLYANGINFLETVLALTQWNIFKCDFFDDKHADGYQTVT